MTRPVALSAEIYNPDCRACQRLASFLDKVKGRLAGAADYVTKPFEPLALLAAVRRNID